MFYIQTQDGELPYKYKIYATLQGARKAAFRFMRDNTQRGVIAVCNAFHTMECQFVRQNDYGRVIEEIPNDEDSNFDWDEIDHGHLN